MQQNKLILCTALLCLTALPIFGQNVELNQLTAPKPPAYRVGISETPEQQYIQAIEDPTSKVERKYANLDNSNENNNADLTYADLSIKRLSKEISQELEYEEKEMVSDLSLLWQGAATQSDTINFALYKLANPDADKPDEKSIKKVLSTIASMSTLVGASMGNPIMAGSALIGGNILGIMGQDVKALNYKYTKVNDADMIILIRKVEDLQQKAIDLYYDYMSAKKQLEYVNNLVTERQNKFDMAQKNNAARELIVITDAYYRAALDKQRSAKSEFYSKRAALEQFVGNETFLQFESELVARENGETPVKKSDENSAKEENTLTEEQQQEYDKTVQNIENYTSIVKPEFLPKEGDEKEPEVQTYSQVPISRQISQMQGGKKFYPYEYNYDEDRVPDVKLPDEGGFYNDFVTGFAVELSLDEFFDDKSKTKDKKNKIFKEKQKKEKSQITKTEKESLTQKLKNKLQKENPQEENTDKESFGQSLKNKFQKKQPPEEKPVKVKKEKQKIKKPKKEHVKKEKIKNEIPQITQDDQILQEPSVEEVQEQKETKKKKPKKEKIKQETSEETTEKPEVKKQKKVKDPYPELHGQKPIRKYPRNSTKDLIFLHGHDKQGVKKPSDGGMSFPQEKYTKKKKNKDTDKENEQQTITQEQPVATDSTKGVEPESYNVPKGITTEDFIPLMGTPKPVQKQVQAPNDFGLPPLDPIQAPSFSRGGYSIHSEY